MPISHADISPYYDQVEQLIGVCGGTDDSEVLPGSKFLQPPRDPGVASACCRAASPSSDGGRRPTREHDPADAVSTVSLLRQLRRRLRHGILLLLGRSLATVRDEDRELEIRSNAVVARILTGDTGLATGVQHFDRRTGAEQQVRGKSSSSARVAWTRPASC